MKTRTELLVDLAREIYRIHQNEIESLQTRGPRSGSNARNIPGWVQSPNGTITKACNLSNIPVLPWWSGSAPTPSGAIPSCCALELKCAYNKIFKV